MKEMESHYARLILPRLVKIQHLFGEREMGDGATITEKNRENEIDRDSEEGKSWISEVQERGREKREKGGETKDRSRERDGEREKKRKIWAHRERGEGS